MTYGVITVLSKESGGGIKLDSRVIEIRGNIATLLKNHSEITGLYIFQNRRKAEATAREFIKSYKEAGTYLWDSDE